MTAAQIMEPQLRPLGVAGLSADPKPSFAALCWNCCVMFVGQRSFVNEKLSPRAGGAGNFSASSGSFTRERSTCEPSGTPAIMRRHRLPLDNRGPRPDHYRTGWSAFKNRLAVSFEASQSSGDRVAQGAVGGWVLVPSVSGLDLHKDREIVDRISEGARLGVAAPTFEAQLETPPHLVCQAFA
jgi:hypothetical protein